MVIFIVAIDWYAPATVGGYSIKFIKERNLFELVNAIQMNGPNMKYGYGALVSKNHKSLLRRL